jgi:hypothetical protein
MITFSVGIATGGILFLPFPNHKRATFLNLRNPITSLNTDEIKRVKLHPVKCPKCKANLMIWQTEDEKV